jgi:hypothetical protein
LDLKNNKITIGELYLNTKAKRLLDRNFPVLLNPFILTVALKMSLENTLKLATGSNAPAQVASLLSDLRNI